MVMFLGCKSSAAVCGRALQDSGDVANEKLKATDTVKGDREAGACSVLTTFVLSLPRDGGCRLASLAVTVGARGVV